MKLLRQYRSLLVASLFAFPGAIAAYAVPTPVADAIESMRAAAWEQCSYRMTTDGEDGTIVETYRPGGPGDGWTLVSVDGKPPSNRDLKSYGKLIEERADRDHPCDVDLSDFVDPASVELIEETDSDWVYAFRPIPDDEEDEAIMKHMAGTLRIDKAGSYVTELKLQNDKPFSPAVVATIHEMRVTMRIEPSAEGPYMIVSASSELRGKLFGVRKIEQKELVRYTEIGR